MSPTTTVPSRAEPARPTSDDPGLAIETRRLSKRYGDRTAVDGLDLRLRRGVVTGFVA